MNIKTIFSDYTLIDTGDGEKLYKEAAAAQGANAGAGGEDGTVYNADFEDKTK